MTHKMWMKIFLLCVCGFTKSLTTSFDLGGVLSGNRMAGVPLGRSLGDGELDVEGICSEAGVTCQNCTHAVTCIPLPVGWLKLPLQECTDGTTCNANLGQCSTNHVPECNNKLATYEHVCEQVGIFPDAFDCRKFHLCSPPEGYPDGKPADRRSALCPRHYGYNPYTAQCSVKLAKGQCSETPVPECTKIGQTGALRYSVNHYYVCLSKRGRIYPQIFLCPNGWYFWEGFCRSQPPIEKITEEPTTEIEDTTTEETTSKLANFFSTEKSTTYTADTFLADKFDLSNYEAVDTVPTSDDFVNSYETGLDIW
ncbi:uncharacterized protein LOC113514665 [Galleria mellonella]|uniref:Uncharacterized protein LOC113514665 n=1 Tax=Galleria mellonella TaxID=7137 RepID=A0A6J1WJA8_GALME|nr:uncharacterized protein LOC113514665 [Galleria mellonella]